MTKMPIGVFANAPRLGVSVHLDIRSLGDAGPKRQFVRQHFAKLFGRADCDIGAEMCEPGGGVRGREGLAKSVVELVDDLRRRFCGVRYCRNGW